MSAVAVEKIDRTSAVPTSRATSAAGISGPRVCQRIAVPSVRRGDPLADPRPADPGRAGRPARRHRTGAIDLLHRHRRHQHLLRRQLHTGITQLAQRDRDAEGADPLRRPRPTRRRLGARHGPGRRHRFAVPADEHRPAGDPSRLNVVRLPRRFCRPGPWGETSAPQDYVPALAWRWRRRTPTWWRRTSSSTSLAPQDLPEQQVHQRGAHGRILAVTASMALHRPARERGRRSLRPHRPLYPAVPGRREDDHVLPFCSQCKGHNATGSLPKIG